MILKSYFDGGNEADSTQYDVVTLASISGTTDQLRPFTQEWEAVLKKHKAPSVHTTFLVSRKKKPFRNEDGWSENQTNNLITDCIEVIKRHIALPREDPSSRVGLLPFTVTIVLKDFLDARSDNPDVPKNAAEVCAVQNAFGCLQWGADIMGADFYHFFFDQNEPYRGHICDRLQNPKAMKQLPLLQKITKIAEGDSEKLPALQMADLFAWCVSRPNAPRFKWHEAVLKLPRMKELIDYNEAIKPIPGVPDLIRSWKLPQRKPTRWPRPQQSPQKAGVDVVAAIKALPPRAVSRWPRFPTCHPLAGALTWTASAGGASPKGVRTI